MSGVERRHTLLLLCSFVLLALAIRLMPVAQVVRPDGVRFYDSDSFYHLRRIELCLEHFPRVPIHDPYSNYPHGGVTMWPPLNDAAMAGIAMLVGGADPPREVVERVAAFYPVAIGALTVLPLFALGALLANRRTGLLAAGLLAIQPAHVLYSAVGRPDQHVTEILGSVTLFACVLALPSLAPPGHAVGRRRRRAAIGLGALAGAGTILVWMGALLFHGVVAGFAGLVALSRLRRSQPGPAPFAREVLALVTAEAAILSAATAYLLAGMETRSTYVSFSWFQAHFVVVSSLALAAFLAAVVWIRQGSREALRSVGPAAAVLVLLAALLVPTGLTGTVTTTLRGVKHVSKSTELLHAEDGSEHVLSYNKLWIRNIQEYQPLLFPRGRFDPARWAMPYVGPVLFAIPLLLLVYLGRRDGPPLDRRLLLPVWTAATAAMALNQVKYVYLVAPLAAFFIADLVVVLMRLEAPTRRLTRCWPAIRGVTVAVVAAALLGPGLRYLADFNRRYVDLEEHLRGALLTLERITPEPGDYTGTEDVPAYGVLAFWDLGNYMQYLSRRPVVANNNGYGFEDTLEFYFAKDLDEARPMLDRRGVRYLVLTNRMASLATIWEQVNGELAPYFRADAARRLEILEPFDSLLYTRLYFGDGQPLVAGDAPVPGMRLIHEQPGPWQRLRIGAPLVAPVKIFERVPGARLVGSGFEPGEHVALETLVSTNLERGFLDRRSATVKPDGSFELRAVYGPEEQLPVHATAWQLVRGDGSVSALTLPPGAVAEGGTLRIRADGAAAPRVTGRSAE